jgi:hypothetical protein
VIPIFVQTVNEEHPELSRRQLTTVLRAMHQVMGDEWAQNLLPEHFRPSAFRAFGYQPRTVKYNAVKMRMFRYGLTDKRSGRKVIAGPDTPLVYTGRLREEVLASANVRAFPTRVRITMSGPVYFTLRPYKSKTTIRIANEILAMNDRHSKAVSYAGQRGYVQALGMMRRSGKLKQVDRPQAA